MGICYQQSPKHSKIKTAPFRRSLDFASYNKSFYYDPSDPIDENNNRIFFVNLGTFSEAEHVLQKEGVNRIDHESIEIIKEHLKEVRKTISHLEGFNGKCNHESVRESGVSMDSENIINFQIIRAYIPQIMSKNCYQFLISFGEHEIALVSGTISNGVWLPTDQSQFRINKVVPNEKGELPPLKINCQQHMTHCTILCSNQTFKHPIPVVQVAHLHMEGLIRPAGHLLFKIQHISSAVAHNSLIINYLQIRQESLTKYLEGYSESNADLDESLTISNYDCENSLKSSMGIQNP